MGDTWDFPKSFFIWATRYVLNNFVLLLGYNNFQTTDRRRDGLALSLIIQYKNANLRKREDMVSCILYSRNIMKVMLLGLCSEKQILKNTNTDQHLYSEYLLLCLLQHIFCIILCAAWLGLSENNSCRLPYDLMPKLLYSSNTGNPLMVVSSYSVHYCNVEVSP